MLWRNSTVSVKEFQTASGWQFKPEGACKGDVCIPLAQEIGDKVALADLAEMLGMPLVVDATHNLYALGPEAVGSRALTSAQAAPLTLPDLEGKPFDLASLRGKKVLLYAWAPY